MLTEGEQLKAIAAANPLTVPALAVSGFGGPFTVNTIRQTTSADVASVHLDGHPDLHRPNRC